MPHRSFLILLLSFILIFTHIAFTSASTLGPAETIGDLRAMLEEASAGDTLLISGEIIMDERSPLTISSPIRITSQSGETAILRGLCLSDSSITFSNIHFEDSLFISGSSDICLSRGTRILGSDNHSALSFTGSGTLIIEPGCSIEGSAGHEGISIHHSGNAFYGSIEGYVRGGNSEHGGTGVVISPLLDSGAVLLSGVISGGDGVSLGGHALNLYNLSGNAFITIDGTLTGGSGFIGGDGIHLISMRDNASVGVQGNIRGGAGQSHGGSALILMNASGSSSVNLSGTFSGGNAIGTSALPGTSLHLVGNSAVVRTRIDNCILEEGKYLTSAHTPTVSSEATPLTTATPLPTPTPQTPPRITPLPEITAPANDIAYIITPEPPAEVLNSSTL